MEKSRDLLLNVYQQIYGLPITMVNLTELATNLSQIAERRQPWTGKYLHSLLKEYPGFSFSNQLCAALTALYYRANGIDEIKAQAIEATILAVHALPADTVVLGRARRCAAPDCQIRFVPTHPRQKYHSKACVRKKRRLKRRNRTAH